MQRISQAVYAGATPGADGGSANRQGQPGQAAESTVADTPNSHVGMG